jgi:hypothetical protein
MNELKPFLAGDLITVCMVCHPGETVFKSFPEWQGKGYRLSHGVCVPCKLELMKRFNLVDAKPLL